MRDMGTYYQMTENDIPICFIDGSYLFICVDMKVEKSDWSFSYEVDYAVGQVIFYSSCWVSPNDYEHNISKNSYILSNTDGLSVLMTDRQFSFIIKLKNTPGYNAARISLPFEMMWSEKQNYPQVCELITWAGRVRIDYLNE